MHAALLQAGVLPPPVVPAPPLAFPNELAIHAIIRLGGTAGARALLTSPLVSGPQVKVQEPPAVRSGEGSRAPHPAACSH